MTRGQRFAVAITVMLAISAAMYACAWNAFADAFTCERGNVSLMVRPQGEATALCELAGARRGAEACTIIGPPATIIMPNRESARASFYTFGFWFDHELQHACGGLRAEPVA